MDQYIKQIRVFNFTELLYIKLNNLIAIGHIVKSIQHICWLTYLNILFILQLLEIISTYYLFQNRTTDSAWSLREL